MGSESKANKEMSIRVIVELLRRVKRDIADTEYLPEKNELTKFGAFITMTMCTAASLRCCEGF